MTKLSEEEVSYLKVSEIEPNVRDINLVAKVLEKGEERTVTNRNSGEEHKVMDVLIGDDTGVLYFSAWNEQIEKLQPDETYQFLKAKTILYKKNIRLSLGRQGIIEDSEEKLEDINSENNISLAEHESHRRFNRKRNSY